MNVSKKKSHKIGVGGAVISQYAKRLVNQVLDSGRLSYGPFLQKFETEFAKLCGRRFAVSSNSGTSSLQVAVHALKEIDGWNEDLTGITELNEIPEKLQNYIDYLEAELGVPVKW